jgi:hypothetical protein
VMVIAVPLDGEIGGIKVYMEIKQSILRWTHRAIWGCTMLGDQEHSKDKFFEIIQNELLAKVLRIFGHDYILDLFKEAGHLN